ncbi:hypothetical protein HRbin02_01813 [Candidatus Calditenuaceae archaeon HR02]|nr:hypothetical protein HRbin02_01813 [Candidatus Calditenuaceae archaeon HR02]
MQVFMGFTFLAVSHLFFLTTIIDSVNYLLGHVFQLTALTMLLSATITAGGK